MKNPTGFRFNKEKMDFVLEREKITSPQKALNFLLDKYWWENREPITVEPKIVVDYAPKPLTLDCLNSSVENKTIVPPKKENPIDKLPKVKRNEPMALETHNDALAQFIDEKKSELTESERKDILKQIEEVKKRVRPSYISGAKFEQIKETEINALKEKLK